MDVPCPRCSALVYVYDLERHLRRDCAHYRRGIPVPARCGLDLPDGVVRVEYTAVSPLVRLAVRMGNLARLSGRYPSLPDPVISGVEACTEFGTVVYLPVACRRIAGYFLVQESRAWRLARFAGPEESESVQDSGRTGHRPLVGLAFVCRDFRRRGLARQVLSRICIDHHCSPADLVWREPFSPEGFALVTAWTGTKTLAVEASW